MREREDGCWTLPGGWADVGEAPSANAVREVKEESGYEVEARKLLAVYDRDRQGHPADSLACLQAVLPVRSERRHGVRERRDRWCRLFLRKTGSRRSRLTRTTPAQIAHMFDHRRHPEWPTSFD